MKKMINPLQYRHDAKSRLGVLITNLGTPSAPTEKALRVYLAEFLSDQRVVEMPKILWQLILHLVILRIRPKKSAKLYQSVWTASGSPLLSISLQQTKAIQQALQEKLSLPVAVALGMRYGEPAIASALSSLAAQSVTRLLVLPLYPQYSSATTASTFDAIATTFQTWRWLPEFRFISQYHDDSGYLNALISSIRHYTKQHGEIKHLLFSFHGTPKAFFEKGDPYYYQSLKTAQLVAEKLALPESSWEITFQSRVGAQKWLMPYTDMRLKALPGEGKKQVHVICPGFSVDCLETIEEIDQQNRAFFMAAGGEDFHYIPALNDDEAHIQALTNLILKHCQGWPEATRNN